MRASLLRPLMLALLGAPVCAGAQDLDAGWEGDRAQGYSYARLLTPLGARGPHALMTGLEAGYLYDSWTGDTAPIQSRSAGAAFLLGYRYETERCSATLASGYGGSWTSTRPEGSAASTTRAGGIMALAELSLDLNPAVMLSAAASYEDAGRYSWARAGVGRRIVPSPGHGENGLVVALGPEAGVEWGPDDHTLGAGGLLVIEYPAVGTSLELRAGPRWSWDGAGSRETARYWGVAISRSVGE